jgi:hypothetical protein
LFLALFRLVCPVPDGFEYQAGNMPAYLYLAVIMQSILWIYMTWRFSEVAAGEFAKSCAGRKIFRTDFTTPDLVRLLSVICLTGVSALNRFVAPRHSSYSESVMTESLAMPLYVLVSINLYLWTVQRSRKNLALCIGEALLLMLIRTQMISVLALIGAVSFVSDVIMKRLMPVFSGKDNVTEPKRNVKAFIVTAAAIVLVFSASILIEMGYNLALRGYAVRHTGRPKAMFSMLMYISDESDAHLFDEKGEGGLKDLFLNMSEQLHERGLLMSDAPDDGSWYELENHFAGSYDIIGFDIAMPAIYNWVDEHYKGLDYVQRELRYDEVQGRINSVLMHQDMTDYAKIVFTGVLDGLLCSVAMDSEALIPAAFVLYVLYMLLWLICARHIRRLQTAAGIVLCGILTNIMLVALVIFPQGRYMTYGMGMFYAMIMIIVSGAKVTEIR